MESTSSSATGKRTLEGGSSGDSSTAPISDETSGELAAPSPARRSASSKAAPDPAVILQDAQVHVLMALDAYTSGDLPATRQELDVALETLLVADFPRGDAALKVLGQNLPPGYEGFDLARVYKEAARRGKAVEVTHVAEAAEAEKEIGGPQGLGEPVPPAPVEAAAGQSAPPPRDVDKKGKGAGKGDGDVSEYLSAADAEFVRKEIARIVEAFGEKNYPHSDVFEQQVAYFVHQYQTDLRGFFQRSLLRSVKYLPIVQQSLKEKGVPGAMAYIAFVESGFRPNSISNAGAVGLWQFMPKTARAYGLKVDKTIDERLDPEKATVAAREYFLDLVAIFGSNSFLLAMASYNAGEGKVQYCLKQVDDPFTQRTFWDIRSCLRQETREYIPRIIAAAIVAQEPQRFGFADEANFLDPDQYELASIPFPTSLSLLATLSEIPLETLRAANADLGPKDSTTPRDIKNYRLLVPKGRREGIEAELKLIAARKSEDEKLVAVSGEKSKGKSEKGEATRKSKGEAESPTQGSRENADSALKNAERPVAVARVDKARKGGAEGQGEDERIVGAVGEAKEGKAAEETPAARESADSAEKGGDETVAKSGKGEEAAKSGKGEKSRAEEAQAAEDVDTKGAKARAEDVRAAVRASREANAQVSVKKSDEDKPARATEKASKKSDEDKSARATEKAAKKSDEDKSARAPEKVSKKSDEDKSARATEKASKKSDEDKSARAPEKASAKKTEEDTSARASEKASGKKSDEDKTARTTEKTASVRRARDEERDEDGDRRTRFIKYKVQSGNTLKQIARDFDSSSAKLREWNPFLHDRDVKPGDTIFVYELDWSLEKHEHLVARGETLASVAKHYGVDSASIEHFNGLHGGRLEPGKSLVIYAFDKKGHQAAREEEAEGRAAKASREERTPKGPAVVYEVRPGNNLSLIAAMFNVDIRDIMKWNKLTGGQIQAGQKLTLYPERKVVAERYVVKHGDTVPRLAQRYKLEPGYLRAANGLEETEPLKKGQVLLVYKMAK